MLDRKKIYMYALPFGFVFGLVFGTLFIAYVVTAQTSYFNSSNFLLTGGGLLNISNADNALLIPSGKVGIGTVDPDDGLALDIVGDVRTDASVSADSMNTIDLVATNLNTDPGGTLVIGGDIEHTGSAANFHGSVNVDVDDVTVDLSEMFEVSSVGVSKVDWNDNTFPWVSGRVYDDSHNDITSACGSNQSYGGLGHKVVNNIWEQVWCELISSYPPHYPPGYPDGCL